MKITSEISLRDFEGWSGAVAAMHGLEYDDSNMECQRVTVGPDITATYLQSKESLAPRLIKEARLQAGLTQAQLGQALGYESATQAQRYVSGWESGARPVPRVKINALADLLGLDAKDLL